MHNVKMINEDIWWLGASDRRIERFENTYLVPDGMSYNNYLILDEKTCLVDGIDQAVAGQFLENLEYVLGERGLDYMIVNHMEPDHCAIIPELVAKYPEMKLVGTMKTFQIMDQFYDFDLEMRTIKVKEGDVLDLGKHQLSFYLAPMVHWPEVMVTFDQLTGTLFSADAFGSFGAMSGNIFADEVDWEQDWATEARRYYANIVGKYGPQTNNLLKKAANLDIKMICPLHAHIWRNNFSLILDRYHKWATYTPETQSVLVLYGSVYNNTANAADILAGRLAERGIRNIKVYDTSKTDLSQLVSLAFAYSHIVFAAATYNMEIFDSMDNLLDELKKHNLSNRVIGIMENGSWAPVAGSLIQKKVAAMKNMVILEPMVKIKSGVKEENLDQIDSLVNSLEESIRQM